MCMYIALNTSVLCTHCTFLGIISSVMKLQIILFKISPSSSIWGSPSKLDKENTNKGPVNTQQSPLAELLKAEGERKRTQRRPFSPAFEVFTNLNISSLPLPSSKNRVGQTCFSVHMYKCSTGRAVNLIIRTWPFSSEKF